MNVKRAASYFLPKLNGDSHSINDPFAKPSINSSPRARTGVNSRKCSNKSGRGLRCKRAAMVGYKRCMNCTRSSYESIKRNFLTRMILHSKKSDRDKGYTWEPEEYVSRPWLEGLFKKSGPTCYWCGATNLNVRHRTGADGFTLERLSNDLPHLKRNCVFSCGHHNRGSWRKGFQIPPFHILKYRYSLHPGLERETMIKQDRLCLEIQSNPRM